MKNRIQTLIVVAAILSVGFMSSCNKDTNSTSICTDKILDGNETEIDCGGSCSPCPSVQALSATYNGNPYVASSLSVNYSANTDAVAIGSMGTGGASVIIDFVNSNPGPSSVTGASVNVGGTEYTMKVSNPGTLTITSKDTLRSIISGTFNINLVNAVGVDQGSLAGTFTNLRMH